MLAIIKLLAVSLTLFLADEGSSSTGRATLRVQAQTAQQQQQRRRSSSSGSSSSRRQSRSSRPSLHNKNHESTIRNILQPKFVGGPDSNSLKSGNHTSNVAIIVSSSRYWFNYRHVTNALSIYHLLKRGGIDDDHIILMLADDIPCNMRNPFRGKIFPRGARGGTGEDLMEDAVVDYSGTDVTVDAFLRVLLGRHLPGEDDAAAVGGGGGGGRRSLPKLDEDTNVLVYLTGHGGDNFFKFQDGEELMSNDVSSAFSQMYEMGRYNRILFISDTCQAFTMADEIDVPNVYSVGSSLRGQNSYASHSDTEVGQSVIDRYSKVIKDFVDDAVAMTSDSSSSSSSKTGEGFDGATVAVMERLNLFDALVRIPTTHGDLGPNSKVGHDDRLCSRPMNQVPLGDFFAASSAAREDRSSRRVGRFEASLWMNDDDDGPVVVVSKKSSERRAGEEYVEEECAVEEGTLRDNSNEEEVERKDTLPQTLPLRMSPFDPKFIGMTMGFVMCVALSSRIW